MKRCMVILLTLVPALAVAMHWMETLEELHRQYFEESLNYKITCEDPRQKAILEQVRKEQVTFAAGFEAWKKRMEPLRIFPFSPQEPVDIEFDDKCRSVMTGHYRSILEARAYDGRPDLPRHP